MRGTHYKPAASAKDLGRHPGDRPIDLLLTLKHPGQLLAERSAPHDDPIWQQLPHERTGPTQATSPPTDAPDPGPLTAFAEQFGLALDLSDINQGLVHLHGSVAQVEKAFDIVMHDFEEEGSVHRGHHGEPRVPRIISDVVDAVVGLHSRPLARPRVATASVHAPQRSLSYDEVAKIFSYPQGLTGRGTRVGIIQLGGGFQQSDIDAFCASLGTTAPSIDVVEVAGATNSPEPTQEVQKFVSWMCEAAKDPGSVGPPPSVGIATVEATMDIQLVTSLAPDAAITVFFAPNNNIGAFLAFKQAIVADDIDTIVCTWSWNESEESASSAINRFLAQCPHRKKTFITSSGDQGSRGHANDAAALNPQFPATSPYVLSVGGVSVSQGSDGVWSQCVWNTEALGMASGGGFSLLERKPAWQAAAIDAATNSAESKGRGLPDVALLADAALSCQVYVAGGWLPAAGTSAAAPLWGALVARMNERMKAQTGAVLGYLTPLVYRLAREQSRCFHDIVEGNNGAYQAGTGWDACTGVGTPRGEQLLAALLGDEPAV